MNKRRTNISKDQNSKLDIVDAVISSLIQGARSEKKKRTLPLGKETYEIFEANCKKIGTLPSVAIDKFMEVFNEKMKSK
ncbi:MAG: hypothetical protein VKK42_32290 [Lyngbya sp.]|nr:hypothetical protein [Lyngbya sp.]